MSPVPVRVEPRRGRPRKFAVPSRAITLTLPEDVLDALGAIDTDVGRAIVRVMQSARARLPHAPAELQTFGRQAVIVVNPTPSLEGQVGVHLVPLPDGRALISFDQPSTVADLELFISDELESGRLSADDEGVYTGIRDILRGARQSVGVTLIQRQIVVLEMSRTASLRRARLSRMTATRRKSQ